MFLSITNVHLVIVALFKTVMGTEVTPASQRWRLKHREASNLPKATKLEISSVGWLLWQPVAS